MLGSNDYDFHKKIKKAGRQIIILDHHEAEHVSKDAIVINNQLSNYPFNNIESNNSLSNLYDPGLINTL